MALVLPSSRKKKIRRLKASAVRIQIPLQIKDERIPILPFLWSVTYKSR